VKQVSNRLLARQLVTKGGACHIWNPCDNLVEDMREGRCRKRYELRDLAITFGTKKIEKIERYKKEQLNWYHLVKVSHTQKDSRS